ncbi:hypothetical protein LWI28_008302 [Acer negundo]|uniref:3'-5' exonuclease domain-containing protein n=1 Tax=Acer negundo TaxID=4023 RepID=A0AAD5ICV8_ACENE|nr:hypothetical protein LWI28_008302 [Acer negundo]
MIHTSSIPQALKNFLLNKSYSFVGFKVEESLKMLEKDYNLSVGNAIDLTTLATQVLGRDMEESKKAGLEDLCEKVLRKKVAKPKKVEFIGRGINIDKVHYARVNAFISFEIGRTFKSGFFRSLPGFLIRSIS